MSMEKALMALLAAEAEARKIVEEAEKQAQELRERTKQEAAEMIEGARRQEEQEAQRIMEEARKRIQSARNEIMDRAEKQMQHWEELFQRNSDDVLKFITEKATTFPDSRD